MTNISDLAQDNDIFSKITLGEVVDTNDPQQMGRVRAACPYFGEDEDSTIETIPWATPISPFAGVTFQGSRGREDKQTDGPIAYGMFNIPKIGSYVLIACIEGDPKFRVYLGGMFDQFLTHTLPHGRYTYRKTNASQNEESGDEPTGPLSSTENPIQPLYDSQTQAFTSTNDPTNQSPPKARKSFEYRTRGADFGVAGVDNDFINDPEDVLFSNLPDDLAYKFKEPDGNTIENTFGYNKSRIEEGATSNITGSVYDPQIYSWTTPGFHSLSMSDNKLNCRIRFRTTQGHQIIMDDTNERVYISTAGGATWIELDEKGNIDIYGERNISVHAEKDINFTAGDTFRVNAKNGIHLESEGELRISSTDKIGMLSKEIHIKASGGVLNLQSSTDTNILASGRILQTGSEIHFNGPPAAPASKALKGFAASRIPQHEPWARMMTASDDSTTGEFSYNDADVGRKERDTDLGRNPNWHR